MPMISTKNRLPRKTSRCRQRRKIMVSSTTNSPTAVTPQPLPAAFIPTARSVSQGVRTSASRRRNRVLTRSPSPSHGVCAENRKAQVTIRTASTSQAVVLIVNGCGRGGGAPVGRRWRAVRGAGPAGEAALVSEAALAGAPVRSVFSAMSSAMAHPLLGSAVQAPGSAPTPSAHDALAGAPRLGASPSAQHPADALDDAPDGEPGPQGEQEPLPGRVLERPPAEVAEDGGIQGPEQGGHRVEGEEAPPRVVQQARAEGHDRASAGDEAGDQDQLAAALVELTLRPGQPLTRLLAAEEAAGRGLAEAPSDQVSQVVASHRARSGRGHDQRERQMTGGRDDSRCDHGGLARHYRQDGV